MRLENATLTYLPGGTECVHNLLDMLEEPSGMFNVVESRPGHRACCP